jgi:gliding motility-associated-like protein
VLGNSFPELFSIQPAITADGTLTFTPAPNAFGTATIRLVLDNTELLSPEHVLTIVVSPVNDSPTSEAIPNLDLELSEGGFDLEVGGVTPGPENEANQLIQVIVNVSTPGVIEQPVFNYNSNNQTISATIVPVAIGEVTVRVMIRDNGSTANGGVNILELEFVVTVEDNRILPLFLPNIFSPNNDDTNDLFRILEGGGVATIAFRIFDTKGTLLYETEDWQESKETGWNGDYKGIPQPSGTYIWQVTGKYTDGSLIKIEGKSSGSFTLVR